MDNSTIMITAALDECAYDIAEKLIRANTDPDLLNEPNTFFNQITPLTYVLTQNRMNLYLAKLLVEMGANPNLRLEYPLYDTPEATASPMELLHKLIENSMFLYPKSKQISPVPIIGLHNQQLLRDVPSKQREELLELLDIFLARGGNPNVRTTMSKMTLYHKCMCQCNPDMEVVTRLCQAGGDLNQTNVHGTTALMDLIKHANADQANTVLAEIESMQSNVKPLLLNAENCQSETALWLAGFAGSPRMAMELLKRGADASCSSKSVTIPLGMVLNVTPMLAPLLRESFPHKLFSLGSHEVIPFVWSIQLMNKVTSYSMSPIFDTIPVSTCFPLPAVANLQKLTTRLTKFKKESVYSTGVNASEVPVLMFGRLSAGLQQLCVRTIIEQVVTSGPKDQNSTESLNSTAIESLVVTLGLPSVLAPRFAIEAARLQLGFALFKARATHRCEQGCGDLLDNELASSDDDSILTVSSNRSSSLSDSYESESEMWVIPGKNPNYY